MRINQSINSQSISESINHSISSPAASGETESVSPRLGHRSGAVGRSARAEVSALSLPARDGSELIAALTADKIAIRSGFSAAEAGQIKTAVLEGVLNAIEHSPNQEKLVYIEFIMGAPSSANRD